MTRTAKLLLIPVFCAQLWLFLFIAQHRFVDTDEGFYLLAARLVLMHKRPYLDFFFQQAPLLPYVYGLWLKCFHVSWDSARFLSALLTSLLGLVLYKDVCGLTRSWVAAIFASATFASSTLVFAWMPIAKPYSLAGLLIFCAYVLSSRCPDHPRWTLAVGGLLLALAVDTRSYLLLSVPLFLWWILQNAPARWKAIFWFLGGFVVGLLPSLYFFVASPKAFVFDNLGYHAIRTDAGLIGMWGQKLVVLLMLLLGSPEGNGIQNSLLLVISLAFVFSITRPDAPARFAFQIAIVLAVVSLLPTPVLPQYFAFCVPFLIVSAICSMHHLFASLERVKTRVLALSAYIAMASVYFTAAAGDLRKYLVTGEGIPTVRTLHNPDNWRLGRVKEVSGTIDKIARPGETVASFWSGYLFQTQTFPFPGLETDCGLLISDKLNPQQRASYHIASWSQLEESFAAHWPRVVVLENHHSTKNVLVPEVLGEVAESTLFMHGYSVARSFGDTSVYVCCTTSLQSGQQPALSGMSQEHNAPSVDSSRLLGSR